jgi:hypothetical protein
MLYLLHGATVHDNCCSSRVGQPLHDLITIVFIVFNAQTDLHRHG